jgi:hypothetical protein
LWSFEGKERKKKKKKKKKIAMGSRGLQRRMLQVFSLWLRGGQIMCQQTGIIALSCGSASFSTQTTEHAQSALQHKKSVLVRDYIHSALYDPQSGYFSAKAEAVGTISEPIQFSLLQGEAQNYYSCRFQSFLCSGESPA